MNNGIVRKKENKSVLPNKIYIKDDPLTIDEELMGHEYHKLDIKILEDKKLVVLGFTTNLAMYYFAKNILTFSYNRKVSYLELFPYEDWVGGARFAKNSAQLCIDIEKFIKMDEAECYIADDMDRYKFELDFKTFYQSVTLYFPSTEDYINFAKYMLSMSIYNIKNRVKFYSENYTLILQYSRFVI